MANYNSEFTGQEVDDAVGRVQQNASDWDDAVEAVSDLGGIVTSLQSSVSTMQSDISRKAGIVQGTGSIKYGTLPLLSLYDVQKHASAPKNNCAWWSTDGKIYFNVGGTDYDMGNPQYLLYYVGNKIYGWGGSSVGFYQMSSADVSISNDWNDSSRQHVPSARQMNLMYNNLIMVYNGLADLLSKLANSAFSTASPTIGELDWVGSSSSYSIGYSLTHCHKTNASPTSVAEGDSFTATILPDAGYTLNGVTASGSGFTQTYDSTNDKIVISASNVQNGLTITCAAVTFQVSINYTLTGFASESNTTMQSGGSFTKVLSPNNGYVVKTISITMGGTDVTSSVWTASTRTISIPVVTGNIVVTATAEESTAHLITYNLTGCTKTSGPTEVEDGGLTAVLAKDTSSWDGVTDFLARDIVVMMGGLPLERDADFTTSQSGANITVTIPSVTGDVEIMNVVWKNQYVFYESYGGTAAGDVAGNTDGRSTHTSTYIPLASNCQSLAVFGKNRKNESDTTPGISSAYAWGCAVYNNTKAFLKGEFLSYNESVVGLVNEGQSIGASYIRTSAWCKMTSDANHGIGNINGCYIYDITNDKFIWYGTSVDKTSIRNNHQS